ncbi:MAG: MarR family winged helix-turn-helix transcriptional regulator [Candidatus Spyradocola sp.]
MKSNSNGLLFKQIHDSLEKQANNQLRPKGLTMMQVSVLMSLRDAPEKQLSMKEVESRFQVAQSTAAGVVSRLEKKGCVEACGDASDKRVKRIRITQTGEACCAEAELCMRAAEERLVDGFTEQEKTIFHRLLTRVANNVK